MDRWSMPLRVRAGACEASGVRDRSKDHYSGLCRSAVRRHRAKFVCSVSGHASC